MMLSSHYVRHLFAAAFAAAALASHASDLESSRVTATAPAESQFRFLPFYEQRFVSFGENYPESSFYAVRPFYSQVKDPASDTKIYDVLWPLATVHYHNGASWWRALNFYGERRYNEDGTLLDHSFYIFPIWFNGRTRDDVSYWGFFPFYGSHPHFLFMEDIHFVLWPIYMDYSVKGVRSHSVCWPFVSWKDSPRDSLGIWPFYGHARRRESDHWYTLWPLFTWASYESDRDTSGEGYSWMFWPLCGAVSREREFQALFLPPFFSYAKTDVSRRWRLPWPLVDVEIGRVRNRVSVWPLYEHITGFPFSSKTAEGEDVPLAEEHTWRIGWKLVERTRLETDRTLEKRFSFFPFYTDEDSWVKPKGSTVEKTAAEDLNLKSSYFRIWPLYASVTENGETRRRFLELNPIRHSGGTERNWAPFWTFYSNETRKDGSTRHTLFWGIIKFTTGECADCGICVEE